MSKYRVYADFNGLRDSPRTEGKLALGLHYFGTLKDLSRLKLRLRNGLELDVYSDSDEHEDIEASGVVHFDETARQWFVEFAEQDIRCVPTQPEPAGPRFPCWNCATDLEEQIKSSGLEYGDTCRHCGREIHEPIKPPA